MSESVVKSGGCQCGRVRYEVALTGTDAYLCHCRMCQKATGGVAAAFVQVKADALRWLSVPDWYRSSPIAHRPFCAQCGTPLGFAFVDGEGGLDVTVGSLDDPYGLRPVIHAGAESIHEAWLDTRALPRKRTAETASVVRRYEAAGIEVPGTSSTELAGERFPGFDGARLALHRVGAGRPVVLLHGLFSSADMNWIKWGHAAAIAEQGYEVLMPDLRAHGDSAAPQDPAAYPPDALARDLAALVDHLQLTDYDLGGFSLGARTVIHAVAKGMVAPARLIVGGMGVDGLVQWQARATHFTRVIDKFEDIPRTDPAWFAVQFMKSQKIDRTAARLLIRTLSDMPLEMLERVTMPALVVSGSADNDNGSASDLAARLSQATYVEVPGTHMGSVSRPELGRAMADWLGPASPAGGDGG